MNSFATITVKKLTPPRGPGKSGGAQDSSGSWWDVWPGKVVLAEGVTYDIEYSTREYNGKNYHTIQKASSKVTPAVVQSNGHAPAPPRAANDSRLIFITGIVGRAMGSGSFTSQDIKLLTLAAAEAWEALPK